MCRIGTIILQYDSSVVIFVVVDWEVLEYVSKFEYLRESGQGER
jgi:hypothetical protein